jgi:CDP-paratose 2-epimerase
MTPTPPLRDRFGICQWFHWQDYRDVERSVEALHDLGVRHLRTGIAWADLHRPGGKQWFDWQMKQLAQAKLEVLLSVWHTPPSVSEGDAPNSPPRRLRDYADAIDMILTHWGDAFTHLELWNEPNNRYKWDFPAHDPNWRKFGEMIRDAAHWARHRGKPTVLGGMIPVDHHWLELMESYGVLQFIDVVAIHAFPGMWWPGERNWDWHDRWTGWRDKIDYIASHAGGRPIWVTETGCATWDLARHCVAKYELQVQMLEDAAAHCRAQRCYWYSLIDLDPSREAIEGFHVDENEYHMGLIDHHGHKKDAYFRLKELLTADRATPRSRPAAGSTSR